MREVIKNRYEFVVLFDVENGNPNGDPDAGNLPRLDPETGLGLVTDVCLKRKIRNYVELVKEDQDGYKIYIKDGVPLNRSDAEAFTALNVTEKDIKNAKKKDENLDAKIRDFMCEHYYDIRTFGAVMSTGKNAGQVRGPIQLTFARSVNPVATSEHSITRIAVATPKEAESQNGENHTMGRKATIPYGLYVCHGFISANLAQQTGFTEDDLAIFFDALKNMFDLDRSAARGLMSAQKLIVFRHASELGNAPANKLFDLVKVEKTTNDVPRSFKDYAVSINTSALPNGVTVEELI